MTTYGDLCALPSLGQYCFNIQGSIEVQPNATMALTAGTNTTSYTQAQSIFVSGQVNITSGSALFALDNTTLYLGGPVIMQGSMSLLAVQINLAAGLPGYVALLIFNGPVHILGSSSITVQSPSYPSTVIIQNNFTVNASSGTNISIGGATKTFNQGTMLILSGNLQINTQSFVSTGPVEVRPGCVLSISGTTATGASDIQVAGVSGGGEVLVSNTATFQGTSNLSITIGGSNLLATFDGINTDTNFTVLPGASAAFSGTFVNCLFMGEGT